MGRQPWSHGGRCVTRLSPSLSPPAPLLAQLARDNFFHCGVLYEDSLTSQVRTRMELEEDVKIYLEENYERINVPVPQFGGGDPADIIHDFQRVRPARDPGWGGAAMGAPRGGTGVKGGRPRPLYRLGVHTV